MPAAGFEAEAAFWAALTGWPRRRTDLPEVDCLRRPAGMPLRLLLQRTGAPAAGMHLDFPATTCRPRWPGTSGWAPWWCRRVPGDWTTLRDPAGREYCVTARPT